MVNELKKICKCIENADLTNYNTYKLRSECYLLVFPSNMLELTSVIKILKKYKSKYFIIGNGSNIILPEYYDGVIIKLSGFNKCIISNDEVYVESGYMLNHLATKVSEEGYSGLEWATGIPGTIGGAIYGNAGAYKNSMQDVVKSVILFDGNKTYEVTSKELEFDYRESILKKKKSNIVILSCKIKIKKGNIENIKELIHERTLKRIETQPLNFPSCGSVFRNPENTAAGKLIDDIGLKGYEIGGAKISEKHANFIINNNNATSKDIISLIKFIKKEIKKNYDIDLVLEQEIIK